MYIVTYSCAAWPREPCLIGQGALFVCLFMSMSACTEVELAQFKRQLCGGSQAAIERMIHFGRELQSMSEHLRRERGKNAANKKMLKVRSP